MIPRSGRSSGEGNGHSLQYSCLENSMDQGAWQTIVHGVTKSWTHMLRKILVEITHIYCGSASKESACNVGDLGSIPRLGRSLAEGKGYPPQSSGLENSTDCIVHGVAKSRTQMSGFDFSLSVLYQVLSDNTAPAWVHPATLCPTPGWTLRS